MVLLSYGARLRDCIEAAEKLDANGLTATPADARFAKPLDEDIVKRLAGGHEMLVTIEEGAVGGFATQVTHVLARHGAFDSGLVLRPMITSDAFLDHDTPQQQFQSAKLDSTSIASIVMRGPRQEASYK